MRGKGAADCKVEGYCAVSYAKTAEPIEMPFWTQSGVCPRKHVLNGSPYAPIYAREILKGKGAVHCKV